MKKNCGKEMGALLVGVIAMSAMAAFAGACGAGDSERSDDADVEGIDIDSPADTVGGGRVELLGETGFDEVRNVSLERRGQGAAFAVRLKKDAEVTVEIGASGKGRLRVYGPRKPDGKWGSPILSRAVSRNGSANGVLVREVVSLVVEADGAYAVAFVSLTPGAVSAALKVTCRGDCALGTCSDNGRTWNVGESFPDTDGCNTCSCHEGGEIWCTERRCG